MKIFEIILIFGLIFVNSLKSENEEEARHNAIGENLWKNRYQENEKEVETGFNPGFPQNL